MVSLESTSVSLEVEATHIPQSIEVDISGLGAGSLIHARDLALPTGAVLAGGEDHLVVNISAQLSQEALDADLAEADETLGVVHEEPDAAQQPAGAQSSSDQTSTG
jgi:large subunit ribosomal protein L25